jgi:LysM repeat protein
MSSSLLKIAIGLFLISLFFGNSYLSSQIMFLQKEGEEFLIKEDGCPVILEGSSFAKTAYAYHECLSVDGSQIIEGDFEENNPIKQDFLIIINSDSFLSINSPVKFLLPSSQRHTVFTYVVQEGDTPGRIAANFGVSLNTILWANNLKSSSIIKPNQELVILPISGVMHIVKKGDTLLSIAKKYQTFSDEISVFNNLNDESSITIGQELIIPNGRLSSATSLSLSAGLKPMTIDISHWPEIDGFFAYPTSFGLNRGIFHYYNAVDIVSSCGSPIYASADGIIVDAKGTGKYNYGYGNLIKIQHYNGITTVYGHLSTLSVKEGDKVYQGDLIGKMGDTGNAECCHLHFEVRGAQNPFVKRR